MYVCAASMEAHSTRSMLAYLVILCSSIGGFGTQAADDGVDPFRELFTRIPGARLSAIVGTHIPKSNLEQCAHKCVLSTEFNCKSFDFDSELQVCALFSVNLQDKDVFTVPYAPTDHWESNYLRQFSTIPKHRLPVIYVTEIPDMTPEACSRHCVLETRYKCRGFNIHRTTNLCYMLEHSPSTSTSVVYSDIYDYYQRNAQGSLGEFINYGMGRLRPIAGSDVYEKHIMGAHLDHCAEACLHEDTFDCRSFDYVHEGERSTCYLSKLIAGNTYGLVVDSVNPRHNHYELMEEYLRYFYATPYAVLPMNNLKMLSRVTPNRCARFCVEEESFICRSFDYKIEDGTCVLSSKTGSDVGGLYTDHGFQNQVHHFEMKPVLDCGGNLTDDKGNFASPGWPRNYSHLEHCIWQITAKKHMVIKLTFPHVGFHAPHPDPCNAANDRLVISEAGQRPTCLRPDTAAITTKSQAVTLTFITNTAKDAAGFRAFYSAEWTCNVLLTAPRGEIASPSWPENYPAASLCSWRITAPEGYRVRLTFSQFDLEQHTLGHCNEKFDHVKILDGAMMKSAMIGLYCGTRAEFTVTSSGRDMFIQFRSDNDPDNAKQGFHAHYLFESQNGSLYDAGGIEGPYKDLSEVGAGADKDGAAEEEEEDGEEHEENAVGALGAGSAGEGGVSYEEHSAYKRSSWAVITVLLLLLVAAVVCGVLVWRYYRHRLKRQEELINGDCQGLTDEEVPLNTRETSLTLTRPRDRPLSRMGGKPNNIEISGPYPMGAAPLEAGGGAMGPPEIDTINNPTYGKYARENMKNINLDTKA